jgi:hypothetical protein
VRIFNWLDDEANGWRRAGLDVIVSLLEENEAEQLGLVNEGIPAESKGIGFITFPFRTGAYRPRPRQLPPSSLRFPLYRTKGRMLRSIAVKGLADPDSLRPEFSPAPK